MKLKEIKPGMVIHCKNDEEKKALYQELCRIGNIRTDLYEDSFPNFKNNRFSYLIKDLKNQTWGIADCATVEFSDLILPELTAEEAIKIFGEICKGSCQACPLYAVEPYEACENLCYENPEKIVEILAQWKSDHEKKEPEIETVDICRIIEIQPDGKKRCVHEEDISDGELMYSGDAVENCRYILKNYCKEHDGEFIAVHEVVSRVKAVE